MTLPSLICVPVRDNTSSFSPTFTYNNFKIRHICMGMFNRLGINRVKVLMGLADAMLINVAVLASIAIRLIYFIMTDRSAGNKVNYTDFLRNNIVGYRNCAVRLTLVCLVVFSLSGLYSYGRTYRGRYKALVVIYAVSSAYYYLVFFRTS